MSATSAEADFRSLPIAEMEARIARFEDRINRAQAASPPTKAWVKEALSRRGKGRCPVRLKRLSLDIIIRYGDALADLFCQYPDDVVAMIPYEITIGYQPPDAANRTNPVEVLMRGAQWTDEWGTRWGHALGGVGATPVGYPLLDWADLDQYLAHRMPKARQAGRYDSVLPILETHGAARYCFGIVHLALFERFHCLRSMANVFTDFYTHEDEVRRLLDALCGYLVELIRMWGEMGADGVFLTDDWGSQTSLMISPAMWRKFFKPHYATVFAEAHRFGMDVIFHSCGNVTQIVGDLIEVGMDVLDPVQPEAMDMDSIARQFGGKVAFSGAIDLQHLLTSGTPSAVRDGVRHVIETLGRPFGGSLIVSPANVMTPEIPLENLRALFQAAHEQA